LPLEVTVVAISSPVKARVAHEMPGRMRLRLPRSADIDAIAQRLESLLASRSGAGVERRPSVVSLVIHYPPRELDSRELVEDLLPQAGIELERRTGASDPGPGSETAVASSIFDSLRSANRRVATATCGRFDLRDAVPLTLIGLGLRKVVAHQTTPVPWYNLLYYGYAAFLGLHERWGATQLDSREILRQRFARGELSPDDFRAMLAELDRSQ
jgi:hypothetical protein